MGAHSYSDLRNHIGHKIECVAYGDPNDPENIAVECTDCNEVLMDFDRPDQADESEWLVDCPTCGKFIQVQKTDPAVCPKCQCPDIDTTPASSLEIFYASDQPEVCRYCGKARTDWKDVGNRQLHTCPDCGKSYWVEEEIT